jgi:hypothetical protein
MDPDLLLHCTYISLLVRIDVRIEAVQRRSSCETCSQPFQVHFVIVGKADGYKTSEFLLCREFSCLLDDWKFNVFTIIVKNVRIHFFNCNFRLAMKRDV